MENNRKALRLLPPPLPPPSGPVGGYFKQTPTIKLRFQTALEKKLTRKVVEDIVDAWIREAKMGNLLAIRMFIDLNREHFTQINILNQAITPDDIRRAQEAL